MTAEPTVTAPPAAPEVRPGWWTRFKGSMQRFFRRLAYLFGPVVVTALLWLFVRWVTNPAYAQEVYIAGSASLFGFGTTVVFGKAVIDTITLGPWQLAFIVMWVNAASCYWYTYNLELLERLPKIGPSLVNMRQEAVQTLRDRPWIRRLSVVGVGAFVVTPLPGSGALGGAIVGRLIGVSRFATFVSVSVAGVVVSIVYAMLAHKLGQAIERVPTWQRIAGAVLVFGGIFLVMRWFTRRSLRQRDVRPETTTSTEPTPEEGAPASAPVAASSNVPE